MELDEKTLRGYMERCIYLAKRAPSKIGRPLVGALVLSEDGKIAGEGYKSFIGGTALLIHAERMALDEAEDRARDSTVITTLEPCYSENSRQIFECCSRLIVERGCAKSCSGSMTILPASTRTMA